MWPFRRKKEKPTHDLGDHGLNVYRIRDRDNGLKRTLLSAPSLDGIEEILPASWMDEEFVDIVSFLPKDDAFKRGLPPQAILGILADGTFVRNRLGIDFMHQVIAEEGFASPDLREAATRAPDGATVAIVDLRVGGRTGEGADGEVAEEDIIGEFVVQNGQLYGYEPNRGHRVLSHKGLMQLPPRTVVVLTQRLRELAVREN